MLLLAIDTATPFVSVAIGDSGRVRGEVRLGTGRRHAEQLTPAIRYLCGECGVPLDHLAGAPLGVSLAAGLLALAAMAAYQVQAIIRARYPGIRAIEALATTAPLFLLLFAATYVLMARADPSNFNVHPLTRTDSLYFTVTVFATVGFGDITPQTNIGRLIASFQMLLGWGILAVPTGIVSAEFTAQRFRPGPWPWRACRGCGSTGHDPDARHCKDCGARLGEDLREAGAEGQHEHPSASSLVARHLVASRLPAARPHSR